MQHNWNELSESTKNFMRNQNFKKELRETYQEGYRDSMNEDFGNVFRFARKLMSPNAIPGGGAGGLFGAFTGDFAAFLNSLIRTGDNVSNAFAEALAANSELLQRLLNFTIGGSSSEIFTKMLKKIISNMEGLTMVPPSAGAIQYFQIFGRQLAQNGMEFFNNNGQVGIRFIDGYDGDLHTGYMAEFYETLGDLFDNMDIPWNDDLGTIFSQQNPGYTPPTLPPG